MLEAQAGQDLLHPRVGERLSYDASADRYNTYAWKTEKAWAGTCLLPGVSVPGSPLSFGQ